MSGVGFPVALITGAGQRIGAAIAQSLHVAGYDIALHVHQSIVQGQALAERLNAQRAGSVRVLTGDLRSASAPDILITQVIETFGRIDALINNASLFVRTALPELTLDAWEHLFAVNVRAPLFLTRASASFLRRARGAVVNVTDLYASVPLRDYSVYCASKAALMAVTRSLALELAPEVRVNAIAPGAVLWPEEKKSTRAKDAIIARTALRRTGQADEIAKAVLWLLREASFSTGTVLEIDGGRRLT